MGKDRIQQCPPLGFNFKPSLMVMMLNSHAGNGSFCRASWWRARYSNSHVRHGKPQCIEELKGTGWYTDPIRFTIDFPLSGSLDILVGRLNYLHEKPIRLCAFAIQDF